MVNHKAKFFLKINCTVNVLNTCMKKSITRIVAYGCSFTAGDEIMDHTCMNMSFEECNKVKSRYLRMGKNYNSFKNYLVSTIDGIRDFGKDHADQLDYDLHRNSSWAAQVAKAVNVKFENRAINGSGLDEHYFNIYRDWHKGLIQDGDLVLVGLTSMNRMPDFRIHRHMPHCHTLLCQFIPEDSSSGLLLDMYNDDFQVFQHFKTLQSLANLNSKITVMMQPMGVWPLARYLDHLERSGLKYTREYAAQIWQECKPYIVSELILDRTLPMCAFGHPSLAAHDKLAGELVPILDNRFKFVG